VLKVKGCLIANVVLGIVCLIANVVVGIVYCRFGLKTLSGQIVKMPGLIRVSEFVEETREDYNSPTTSTFVSRMPQCRQTIASLEEVSEVFQWTFFLYVDGSIIVFVLMQAETLLHTCMFFSQIVSVDS
jgi:hypothetical protein